MSPPSLRVAIVVYANPPAQLRRLACSVSAAVARATEAGSLGATAVAFGDGSGEPVLGDRLADQLREVLAPISVQIDVFGENLGSAGGNNRLVAAGREELVLVVNPDVYVAPTLLVHLLDAIAADDAIAVAEARQIPIEHPKPFDLRSGDTPWASGCCYVARRDVVFEQLGGYDAANFPLYCDDVDLSWRVRLAGHRVVHVPRAVVFHDKRITATGGVVSSEAETYWGALARLILTRRYDRPDLETDTIAWIEAEGSEVHRRALEEFQAREAAGRLPEPLSTAARVADFVGSDYAEHRFHYA